MTKEGKIMTEIKLLGAGVDEFLAYKGVSDIERDNRGDVVVARFIDEENCVDTQFGKLGIEHKLNNSSRNREITIYSEGLRKKGKRKARSISVRNSTGYGYQQLTDRVLISVKTNAGEEHFTKKEID